MKIYKSFLYAFICIGVLSSCEGDLNIELEDDDDLLAEDVFSQPGGYDRAIAGVYSNFSVVGLDDPGESNLAGIDAGTGNYIRGLFNLQSLASDEVLWNFENDQGIRQIQRNSWDANNVIVLGFWARATFEIALANEFLRQTTAGKLDERGEDESTRTAIRTYRAEARVLRALANYHLLDLFRRAPFATENDAVGFTRVPEIAGEDLFSYIETELLTAEADLLDVNPGNATQYGRANKGVAKMILAKLYLNAEVYLGEGNGRFEDCLRVCQEIINSGYSLTPDYLNNFNADNDTNGAQNEIIFPVIADGISVRNFGGASIIMQGQQNPDGNFRPAPADFGVVGFENLFRVRQELSFTFEDPLFDNDERNTLVKFDVPIDPPATPTPPREREIAIGPDLLDRSSGYLMAKYSNITSMGQAGQDQTFVDTDFPLFRLADVYLMYAEAHLRGGGGDIATATQYINRLRERAFNNTTANITDTDLLATNLDQENNLILEERARELHWEAHRRQDLIRFGLYTGGDYTWSFKGGLLNGTAIDAKFNVYPVPASSRSANPNLGQNDGF